jgi:Fur family ferric uptake transcriptional regulator
MLRTDTGESVYRSCAAQDHHHHLVCRYCGSAIDVSGREVESWATKIAEEHGFSDVTHTIELIGTCTNCVTD